MSGESPALRVRDGVRAGLPIALGPFLFGISYGLLARGAGLGSAASIVFSATTFAGLAQFAASPCSARAVVSLRRWPPPGFRTPATRR